jgi:hypothetical protein
MPSHCPGRPLWNDEFVQHLEEASGRILRKGKPDPKRYKKGIEVWCPRYSMKRSTSIDEIEARNSWNFLSELPDDSFNTVSAASHPRAY